MNGRRPRPGPAGCTCPPPTHPTRVRRSHISAAYIGYVAGILTVLSYVPQVVRVWKTRETKDLSYGMFALLVTASVLWITYGVMSTQWPVIATNVGCGVLNVAILAAKVKFR